MNLEDLFSEKDINGGIIAMFQAMKTEYRNYHDLDLQENNGILSWKGEDKSVLCYNINKKKASIRTKRLGIFHKVKEITSEDFFDMLENYAKRYIAPKNVPQLDEEKGQLLPIFNEEINKYSRYKKEYIYMTNLVKHYEFFTELRDKLHAAGLTGFQMAFNVSNNIRGIVFDTPKAAYKVTTSGEIMTCRQSEFTKNGIELCNFNHDCEKLNNEELNIRILSEVKEAVNSLPQKQKAIAYNIFNASEHLPIPSSSPSPIKEFTL